MRVSFKTSFSRALTLFGLLGLGLAQVGCAHPVVVEPTVSVHSRVGHFPVYAHVGVPAPVIYAPPPRVVYTPPPRVVYAPPHHRVVVVPRVFAPVHGGGYRHGPHFRGHGHDHGRHDGRR